MGLSENAEKVYQRLYYAPDEASPTEVHRRVAHAVASVEPTDADQSEAEEKYFSALESNKFRPNSPVLMNAGLDRNDGPPIMSACFVANLQDDLISIFDTAKEAGIIFSHGAGIGINWGALRPKDSPISTGGKASGPLSFMYMLEATARAVKSGGRTRRAAEHALMHIDHPDIREFIHCKDDNRYLRSMNLSVSLTDAFMYRGESSTGVPLREIAESAWKTGEPGVLFIDRVNVDNTCPSFGRIEAVNPCGEQPLLPYQSCCLASINVAAHVRDGVFDTLKFRDTVSIVTRFLDSVISLSGYPTAAYREMAYTTRPIGVGIMGFADLLAILNIPYSSEQGRSLASSIMRELTTGTVLSSIQLAERLGPAPALDDRNNREALEQVVWERTGGLTITSMPRNTQWSTIAPTGTVAISCDCSSGMEPLFALSYDKTLSDTGEVMRFVNPVFDDLYRDAEWYDDAVDYIIEHKGSLRGGPVPRDVQERFQVAHDIEWTERLLMQGAFQRYTSAGISSTINLPSDATVGTIEAIYKKAFSLGLKGVTVFRDGCRGGVQPISFGRKEKVRTDTGVTACKLPMERPPMVQGVTHKVKTGHGNIYLTVNRNDCGDVIEVFANGGKNGSTNAANLEAITRLLSVSFQHGVPLERLSKTLLGLSDHTHVWSRLSDEDDKPVSIRSIPDAVAKVLIRFYLDDLDEDRCAQDPGSVCPSCGGRLVYQEGCSICLDCGDSRCS